MRTDARSDLIRAVGDDSTAAETALWHAVVEMEDWVEAGLLVDVPTVQRLLDRIEGVLAKDKAGDDIWRCLVCGFVGQERHIHRTDLSDPNTAYSHDTKLGAGIASEGGLANPRDLSTDAPAPRFFPTQGPSHGDD